MVYFDQETKQFSSSSMIASSIRNKPNYGPLLGRRRRERMAHQEEMARIAAGTDANTVKMKAMEHQTDLTKRAMDLKEHKIDAKNANKADRRSNITQRHISNNETDNRGTLRGLVKESNRNKADRRSNMTQREVSRNETGKSRVDKIKNDLDYKTQKRQDNFEKHKFDVQNP